MIAIGRTAVPLALLWAAGCAGPASRPSSAGDAFVHPCHIQRADDEPFVDDTQAALQETGCRAALWLDGLFGDDSNVDAARRTHGSVETSVRYSQFEGTGYRTRLRVRFDLPNVKERTSAFFGLEGEDSFIRDRAEAFALRSQFPRIDDREEWLAGLGYALPDSARLQADLRVGASNLRMPTAFIRARLHLNVYADQLNLVYLRLTPFWRTRDGVGATLGLDYNRLLSPKLLLRASQVGTISESTAGMDWLSALILYRNLRDERAIAYQLFARGDTGEPVPVYEYGGRTTYRHPLLPGKLYAEGLLGYSWPRSERDEPRRGSYEVGAGLELPFGQKRP
ncbi:hypothetical protein AAG565_14080 [Fontimonas sp. SYSU GA230001]|uniref:hypothetical protein n=1 Tax=Fontimonas sp. SYSU GA230001 TaxID=3142450 RepID=UPI0032B38845